MSAAAKSVDRTEKQRRDTPRPEYDGFISYSHAVDGRLAPALQDGLHRFAKPWYRLRSLRIFRDDASLAANPALWSAIEDALSRSCWFIVLASPTAASSRWVAGEAEYWLAHRSIDHLLVVLSEGDLAWDEALHRFNPSRTNALPPPLLTAFEQEPRWIDVRWAQSRDDLTLRDPRFRASVAELAAPIHGREKDELTGEDVRQRRRTIRLARVAITGLAALALAASVAAVLAVRSQNAARAQRDRAEEQAHLATSRQLAAQSDLALRQNDLDVALLLSARAFRLRDTAEAWDALVGALNAAPRLERIVHTPVGIHRAISADGRVVAVVGTDRRLHMRNLATGAQDTRPISVRGEIVGLGISTERNTVVVGGRQGAVAIHDLTRSGPPRRFPPLRVPPGEEGPFQGTSFAMAPRGELDAWNGAQISLWDGRQQHRLSPGVKPGSWLLAFNRQGRMLAAASDSDGTVIVWRLDHGRPVGRAVSFNAGSGSAPGDFGEGVAAISFSPVASHLLAVAGFDGTVAFWNADSGKLLMKRQGGRAPARSLAFSHDGRLLAASGTATTIWGVHRRRRVDVLPRYSGGGPAAFLVESQRLATAGARTVAVWNLSGSPSQLARTLAGANARVQRVTYDASRDAFATLDVDGAIRFWNESTLRLLTPTRSFGGKLDLAVSPDGGTVATWPPLTLWYPDQRKQRRVYEIPDVGDVAFTRKGEPVAATSGSGRIDSGG
jgi:WD40 repeat protein